MFTRLPIFILLQINHKPPTIQPYNQTPSIHHYNSPNTSSFPIYIILKHELKLFLSSLTNNQDLQLQKHHKTN